VQNMQMLGHSDVVSLESFAMGGFELQSIRSGTLNRFDQPIKAT
jgi:hypothetical protein